MLLGQQSVDSFTRERIVLNRSLSSISESRLDRAFSLDVFGLAGPQYH
jgi:hypothetical protein